MTREEAIIHAKAVQAYRVAQKASDNNYTVRRWDTPEKQLEANLIASFAYMALINQLGATPLEGMDYFLELNGEVVKACGTTTPDHSLKQKIFKTQCPARYFVVKVNLEAETEEIVGSMLHTALFQPQYINVYPSGNEFYERAASDLEPIEIPVNV